MRFSLIAATIGRSAELEDLCASLAQQTHRDFELIVVDQNSDDRLIKVLESYHHSFAILHLHSAPGLSRARNVGLGLSSGDIIAFPDDDCRYPSSLLAELDACFERQPELAAVTCSLADLDELPHPRFDQTAGELDRHNLFRRSCSATIFVRSAAAERVGSFDERLGLGAGTPWLGGEEHDYLIRLLDQGLRAAYHPEFRVLHPNVPLEASPAGIRRKYGESLALTRTLRTYRYPLAFIAKIALLSLGGAILSLARLDLARTRMHWAGLLGKLRGLRMAC